MTHNHLQSAYSSVVIRNSSVACMTSLRNNVVASTGYDMYCISQLLLVTGQVIPIFLNSVSYLHNGDCRSTCIIELGELEEVIIIHGSQQMLHVIICIF